MMRLDRLAGLVATVGPDGTSPVADAAAARWGLPSGTARYVRTSATCVYAAGGGYLRLVPAAERALRDLRAVAAVGTQLAAAGAPVVSPRPSRAGRWVETVPSPAGDLYVTYVDAAPGAVENTGGSGFERLGRTIARLHQAGRAVDRTDIPSWPEVVRDVVRRCGDSEVAVATEPVLRRCVEALGPPDVLAHGDPQPDNAGWGPGDPVLFDLDDVAVSWAVADLAMAVRDAQPIDMLAVPVTGTRAGAALLRGYRSLAEFGPEQERAVPLVQWLSVAVTYARLRIATGPERAAAPDWLGALHDRLVATADRLRDALVGQRTRPCTRA
jgi:Ser/Thr protein kinase RdoA (MazF antagonist)